MSLERLREFAVRANMDLDRHNGRDDAEVLRRVCLKPGEELGEVNEAMIGYAGQNPRKGVTHTLDDVVSELTDMILTCVVGISCLGYDPAAAIVARLDAVEARWETTMGRSAS
jgi:hypothetical protein